MRFGRAVALFTLALSIGAAAFGPAPAFSLSYPLSQPVSENPANITPHVLDGTVYAIAEVGNRVVVAGSFTKVLQGTVTISGGNTYAGATTVNGGTLTYTVAAGNLNAVTVNSTNNNVATLNLGGLGATMSSLTLGWRASSQFCTRR